MVVRGHSSECISVMHFSELWSAQGSILRPILFLIYTSSLYNINYYNFHVHADDTQIYKSFNFSNLHGNINSVLAKLINLSKRRTLKLQMCSVLGVQLRTT